MSKIMEMHYIGFNEINQLFHFAFRFQGIKHPENYFKLLRNTARLIIIDAGNEIFLIGIVRVRRMRHPPKGDLVTSGM